MRRIVRWFLTYKIFQSEAVCRHDLRRDIVRVTDAESVLATQLYLALGAVLFGVSLSGLGILPVQQFVSLLLGIVFILAFSCGLARRYFRLSGAKSAQEMCRVLWIGQALKAVFFVALMLITIKSGYFDALWVMVGATATQVISAILGFRVTQAKALQ